MILLLILVYLGVGIAVAVAMREWFGPPPDPITAGAAVLMWPIALFLVLLHGIGMILELLDRKR